MQAEPPRKDERKRPPYRLLPLRAQGGQGSIDANSGRQGSGVDWSALRFVELGEDVTECDVAPASLALCARAGAEGVCWGGR